MVVAIVEKMDKLRAQVQLGTHGKKHHLRGKQDFGSISIIIILSLVLLTLRNKAFTGVISHCCSDENLYKKKQITEQSAVNCLVVLYVVYPDNDRVVQRLIVNL